MNRKSYTLYNFYVFLQIVKNSRKKCIEIAEKTGSDDIYALLDEVESDLNEDVNNETNDSDTEFVGNDEVDYNSGSVANASDILVLAANVHSLSSGNPSLNCSGHSKSKSAIWRWKRTDNPSKKAQCELTANILLYFSSDPRSFDVFEKAVDLNKLISHIIAQKNCVHHRMVVIL